MDVTLSSLGVSDSWTTIIGSRWWSKGPSTVKFVANPVNVPNAQFSKSLAIASQVSYDHEILVQRFTKGESKVMAVPTSSPLTIGWAIGLTATLIVSALGIAGGTLAIVHSDINDVRSDVSSVRDGASDDNSALRRDMRQDFSAVNQKLDSITGMLTDMKVEQAKHRK